MIKKVIKVIVHVTEPLSQSSGVHDLLPNSVFILVLCKQRFSLGSSLCSQIILELKNTLCFSLLLPLPHFFGGVLWLAQHVKVAGGDVHVRQGVVGFMVVVRVLRFFFWF